MAKAFVYTIVAALLITIQSTTAFPSDIHYKMTDAERLAFFGSENGDPEYDVFPMSLSGMRHIRETNEAIKCTLNLNGVEINLNLEPTTQYIATKYIPVWSAASYEYAYKKIAYEPLVTAMNDIGEFVMYQDVKNSASLVVYMDRTEKIVIEGFITSRYAIKSLPKHFIGGLLNEIDDIKKVPDVMGGAIASNPDTGFYAVITNPVTSVPATIDISFESAESSETTETTETTDDDIHDDSASDEEVSTASTTRTSPENPESTNLVDTTIIDERTTMNDDSASDEEVSTASTTRTSPENPESTNLNDSTIITELTAINGEPENHERKKRHVQKTLYPEMLIVLDHNVVRYRTITKTLRRTLAYWNAVDLIYRKLDHPKIRLNIAGIIIAADDSATHYIAKDTSVPSISNLNKVSSKIAKYFYKERVRFPINQYDIIVAMTTMKLYESETDFWEGSESLPGYVNGQLCSSEESVRIKKTLNNAMIIHNDGIFGPEQSFFARYEPGYDKNTCSEENCSDKLHPVFLLGSNETECLRNKPLSIKPDEEILPGRWMSMDGQCLNEGYAGSCNLFVQYFGKMGKCGVKGCREKRTMQCVESEKIPLPGTKCATSKYCNMKRQCVYRL